MTSSRATPEGPSAAPWTYRLNEDDTAFVIRDANKRFVCSVSWHSSNPTNFPLKPQSETNVRLMAAAPDLLEALRRIADPEFRYSSDDDEDTQLSMRIADARAAIAKAEGQS